jgi:Leucine-rich repeat (LRR) protein
VEGFCAGVTPCTAKVRRGDRIRVVDGRGPEHPLVYTYYPPRKSHISGYERGQFTLVYPYGGEKALRFEKKGNAWYRVEGENKTIVGLDTTARRAKLRLSEVAAAKPAYLWVKAIGDKVPAVVEAVKDLPAVGLQIRRPSDETMVAVAAIKNLKILCLSGPDGDHGGVPNAVKDVSPLAGAVALEKLNLDGCGQVADLSPLSKLTSLTSLNLEECKGVKDLAPLAGLGQLRVLAPPPTVTDAQLAQVCKAHPGLTHMNLEYCRGLTDLAPLAALSGLEALNLEGCAKVKSVAPLAGLKKLRVLGMASTKTIDADLARVCKDHVDLACLSLGFTGARDLSPLAGMKSLRWLYLGKPASRRSRDLTPIAGLTGLRALNLNGCRVGHLKFLARLTALKTLCLRQCHSLADLTPLAGLTQLEYLSTRYGKEIKDIAPLAGLTRMRNLQLRMCQAPDLAPLSGMKDLRHLDLSECVNISDLKPLHGLKDLAYLTGGAFTKEEVKGFQAAVPGCRLGRIGRRRK